MSEPSAAERIKALRARLGLNQIELAQLLGVSNVSVNRWEHGRSLPHAATIARISELERDGLPGTQSEATPPPSPRPRRVNLIGRHSEQADLAAVLVPGAFVTVVGSAGVGKSTLAAAVLADVEAPFPGGAIWVDLSSVPAGEPVAGAIGRALQIRESASISVEDAILTALQNRQILLVLDTCEHVLPGCAELFVQFDTAASGSTILATSRASLGLSGETVFNLTPLSTAESEQLFVARAADLNEGESALVRQLVTRLDGVPLAIELAASRTSMLSIGQILERMDRQFDLMSPMAAAIAWSCELLTPDEAKLFRALGVFQGSFDLTWIEAVAPLGNAIDLVERLITQSMVITERTNGQVRFRLLDSLASYARQWSIDCGEDHTNRDRFATWIADFARDAAANLRGADQVNRLRSLDALYPNLLPSLTWLVGEARTETALQLATAIGRYARRRAQIADGLTALDRALALPDSEAFPIAMSARNELALLLVAAGRLDEAEVQVNQVIAGGTPVDQARAFDTLGLVHRGRSNRPAALAAHTSAFDLFQQNGDRHGAASARLNIALIANLEADLESAINGCHEAWSLISGLDDIWGEATILANLGEIASRQEHASEAAEYFEQAMVRYRQFGDPEREAVIGANTAELRLILGEYLHADELLLSALAHFRSTGNRIQLANTLYLEGAAAAALGQQVRAIAVFRESLELFYGLDDLMDVAYILEAIARIQLEHGDRDLAIRLWGGMEAIRERERVPDYPLLDYTGTAALFRPEIATSDGAAAFERGYRMPPSAIVSEAIHLGTVTDGPPTLIFKLLAANPRPRPTRYVPTDRQREILRLIADGKTNGEIATELAISPRTVERHLSTIFGHLGVDRRSAAVAVAAARGLL